MKIKSLSFMGAIEWEDKLWFYGKPWNALCSLDTETGEMTVEAVYGKPVQIGAIFFWRNKFFLFFQNSFSVLVYDVASRLFYLVEGNENDFGWVEPKIMATHALVDNVVYIFPVGAACENGKIVIATFNLENEQFQRYILCPDNQSVEESTFWFNYPGISGTGLYAGRCSHNQYLYADLVQGRYSLVTLCKDNIFPYAVCGDGNRVWMTQMAHPDIYCKNLSGGLSRFPVETTDRQPYSRILNLSEYVIALPRYSDVIVLIEKNKMQHYCLPISHLLPKDINKECSKSYSCSETGSYIFVHPLGMGCILKISKMDLSVNNVSVWCNSKKFFHAFEKENSWWQEEASFLTLTNFLDMISSDAVLELKDKGRDTIRPTIGHEIYWEI